MVSVVLWSLQAVSRAKAMQAKQIANFLIENDMNISLN
jgi:hypothetical protein